MQLRREPAAARHKLKALEGTRDHAAVRESLLAAAIQEFSNYGYRGARLDRIASKSLASKRSVYRYFGGKEGLFAAAVERNAVLVAGPDGSHGPLERLDELVDALHWLFRNKPDVARLLLWEALEDVPVRVGGEHLFVHQRHGLLDSAIREGKARSDLDIRQTVVDIVALCTFPFVMTTSYRLVRGDNPSEEPEFTRRREHVKKTIRTLLGGPSSA